MKTIITAFMLITISLMVLSCFSPKPEREISLEASDRRGSTTMDSKDLNSLEPPYTGRFEPMVVDDLEYLSECTWTFNFRTYNLDQPSCQMWVNISLENVDGQQQILHGDGYLIECSQQTYSFDFPSHQPFLDIIDYIKIHDVELFNHTEFEGAELGTYNLPDGIDEYFVFSAWGPNLGTPSNELCIVKGIVPGEEVPEEIQYVIDQLKILRDEILQHPVN